MSAERFYEYLSTGSENEVYSQTYVYTDDGKLSCQTINSTKNPRAMYNLYEYDDSEKLLSFKYDNDNITIKPKTDCLGRNRGKSISLFTGNIYSEDISYLKNGDHATFLPNIIRYSKNNDGTLISNGSIRYKYDEMGNICRVYEDETLSTEYKYDALGRLTRENNISLGLTYLYAYDSKGNIISKKTLSFSLKDEDELTDNTVRLNQKYIYNEQERLVSYGDEELAYDSMGNPTTYRNNSLAWEMGRKLSSFNNIRFTYDAQGRRVSKKCGENEEIIYRYNTKNQIFSQSNGIKYFYDNNSSIYAFLYDEAMYFYKKDIFGNVIEILDSTGATVVKYIYDAWGNHDVLDYTDFGLGELNPIRYRSYYYDTETGLYYLQSRYYDPEVGRFISMDDINYLDPETIGGVNLYAYCLNNPVMYYDPFGNVVWPFLLFIAAGAVIGGILNGKNSYDAKGSRGWDLFAEVVKGASIGTLITGAAVSLVAVFAGAFHGASVLLLGSSIKQVFAIGALAINSVAYFIAPLFGITDLEGIELEAATPISPSSPPSYYQHPAF